MDCYILHQLVASMSALVHAVLTYKKNLDTSSRCTVALYDKWFKKVKII